MNCNPHTLQSWLPKMFVTYDNYNFIIVTFTFKMIRKDQQTEVKAMKQQATFDHFCLNTQSIEGFKLTLLVRLPRTFSALALTTLGFIHVFTVDKYYCSNLTEANINKDITWEKDYLQSLKSFFRKSKPGSISLRNERLQIKLEISKGVRITVLSVFFDSSTIKQGDTTLQFIEMMSELALAKMQESTLIQQEISKLTRKNNLIRDDIDALQEKWQKDEQNIKDDFVDQINKVKLEVKSRYVRLQEFEDLNEKKTVKDMQLSMPRISEKIDLADQLLKFFG